MSEVVERAAKAAHEKGRELARKFGENYRSWDELPAEAKTHVIECQRAAIEAMREPSVEMSVRGDLYLACNKETIASLCWRTMIDGLLSD